MPDENLPSTEMEAEGNLAGLFGIEMRRSPGLFILSHPKLRAEAWAVAGNMARSGIMIPAHLRGQPEACFAVYMLALTWKLDPYMVGRATYTTPGGSVGFEGKLVQAILENSGRLDASGIKQAWWGPWENVQGKFEIATSKAGHEYAKRTWTRKDAEGCGITISAKVRGETKELEFALNDAFPLNSTLWALRPKIQIAYTAIRAFANLVTPGILMGLPMGEEDMSEIIDVTPVPETPPRRRDFKKAAPVPEPDPQPEPEPEEEDQGEYYQVRTPNGPIKIAQTPEEYKEALLNYAQELYPAKALLAELWSLNIDDISRLPDELRLQVKAQWPKVPEPKPQGRPPAAAGQGSLGMDEPSKQPPPSPPPSQAPAGLAPAPPPPRAPSPGEYLVFDHTGTAVGSAKDQNGYVKMLISEAKAFLTNLDEMAAMYRANRSTIETLREVPMQTFGEEWDRLRLDLQSKG